MISIHPKYEPLWTSDKKYILLTGGRGSMKSFSANTFLALLSHERGHKIMSCRYTLTSAQDSVIPEFKEKVDLLEVPQNFEIQKTSAVNIFSGVHVLFRGVKTSKGSQTAKLKSIPGLTTVFFDEFEEFDSEDDFDTIVFSVRKAGIQNRIIMAMNPPTDQHWCYDRWFKDTHRVEHIDGYPIMISTHPEVCHIHTTYLDAKPYGYLHESFLTEIEKLRNGTEAQKKKYAHKILGQFADKKEGVVYEDWRVGEFNDNLSYCYGLDLGYFPNPTALVKIAVDPDRRLMYWKQKIYSTKLSTPQLIEGIIDNLDYPSDMIISDTNESRTIRALRDAGLNVRKAYKGGVAEDLRNMTGYTHIVDPDSPKILFEFKNYVWNDKKASIPEKDNDHALDGGRYAAKFLTNKWKV